MSDFGFPGQTRFYRGKVRDVYAIQDRLLVMVVSDRISAFDVILPRPIPHKGQVLNQVAAFMLEATRDICPNWLLDVPAPNVSVGLRCEPIRVEIVVRGNLVGHAWRTYASGRRELCGVHLPEGLHENDFLPEPVITPTTKAAEGHDEDISRDQILEQQILTAQNWQIVERYAFELFERGTKMAADRGLILADTKYEFGYCDGEIFLMDEVHTPDSSRYFYAEGFEERQAAGERQRQLSKEFVREWLIENNFMGKSGQKVPEMSDEWVQTISRRYIELFERLTGAFFRPETLDADETRRRILHSLGKLLPPRHGE
ncbi:MAG TPA: phosphoribosylaminoimidazolesuccinocarboxamide synthase [Chitinophagaceae bacterium]|nr:phosphoribosylaminoimidazolesuccinocarboxamide synthase [Chitinophagaceae bacterium]